MATLPERWFACLDTLEHTVCSRFALAVGLSQEYVLLSEIIALVTALNTWPSASAHQASLIKVYLLVIELREIDDIPRLVVLVNRDWMFLLYAYLLTVPSPPPPRSCSTAAFIPGQG